MNDMNTLMKKKQTSKKKNPLKVHTISIDMNIILLWKRRRFRRRRRIDSKYTKYTKWYKVHLYFLSDSWNLWYIGHHRGHRLYSVCMYTPDRRSPTNGNKRRGLHSTFGFFGCKGDWALDWMAMHYNVEWEELLRCAQAISRALWQWYKNVRKLIRINIYIYKHKYVKMKRGGTRKSRWERSFDEKKLMDGFWNKWYCLYLSVSYAMFGAFKTSSLFFNIMPSRRVLLQ